MAKFANYLMLFLLVASLVMLEAQSSDTIKVPDLGKRLLMNRDPNGIPCAESCVWIPCTITALMGCSCKNNVCYNNEL
uniref:Chassatide C2 n=1 Tax=Chassalia chartacea TaxID=510798 RepID=CYC2_CHACT|nr:RecName: Full=Chassatide C2; AltName: Full=Cyclotide chaC2; Flags: Precursor [Chassalia chartacea]AFH57352.1 cyclotide precursor chassatide C2 [Chassalia chartacea]